VVDQRRIRFRRAVRWAAAVVVIAMLLDSAWTPSQAATPKEPNRVDPALLAAAKASPNSYFDVIVVATSQKARLAPHAKTDTADRAGKAVKRLGGTPRRALGIVGGASAKVRGATILGLAIDKDVAFVYPDARLISRFDPQVNASLVTVPGQREVHAPDAWSQYGVTGRGVGVAIVDSGIYAHPDLAGRVLAAIDFTTANPTVSTSPLGDPGGHGTHVGGLVAGDGSVSGGAFAGVAPGADLVDVRVIDENGASSVSMVLAGLQWILANRATYHIRVVNLSLGATEQTSYTQSPLSAAVEVLFFAGINVIVSAGNSGPGGGTIATPGDDPFVITVGAVDDNGSNGVEDDSAASWSSCGPTTYDGLAKPDLAAPGRHMVSLRSPGSALDRLLPEREVTAPGAATADYFMLSGTSMAAPLVAGTVALMLEREPSLTPRQVKQRLVSTVTPLSFGTTLTRGAGLVNALSAVGSTDTTRWSDTSRVSDGFARLVFPLIYGQPLVWDDPSFNGGVDSNGIRWGDITWDDITWDSITWEDITWDDITWDGITWESVAAQDITWDTTFEPLSSSGAGWVPLN
jgi:serine protease AprX